MFDRINNRLAWEKLYMDEALPFPLKNAIRSVFIPYNIDVEKFWINCDCIENCCERDSNGHLASKSVLETVRDINYKYSCINCSNMPIWYYMAFPDVFLWTISDSPSIQTLLEEVESKFGSHLLDSTGEVSLPVVKYFIESYIKTTNKKLECSK